MPDSPSGASVPSTNFHLHKPAGITCDFTSSHLKPVIPGTILQDIRSPNNVTNLSNAFYSAGETGSEAFWVNLLLGGFINGTVPENIVFSENGAISNFLIGALGYKDFIRQWDRAGQPENDKRIYTFNYGPGDQGMDLFGKLSFNSISNFVGSSMATVLYNPDEKSVSITITNVTSVASGDLGKHFLWHKKDPTPLLFRDPEQKSDQPFTNFFQTYRLKLSYD